MTTKAKYAVNQIEIVAHSHYGAPDEELFATDSFHVTRDSAESRLLELARWRGPFPVSSHERLFTYRIVAI